MSQTSQGLPPRRCPQCGAAADENAKTCWLCAAPASETGKGSPAPALPSQAPDANPWLVHGAIWLAVIAAAIVGYGVFAQDVINGLGYLILVAPPILITLLISTISRAAGSPTPTAVKVTMGVLIAALSVPLAVLAVIFVTIIALFQICTTGESPLLDFLGR